MIPKIATARSGRTATRANGPSGRSWSRTIRRSAAEILALSPVLLEAEFRRVDQVGQNVPGLDEGLVLLSCQYRGVHSKVTPTATWPPTTV
jgi:hypothetical protein